MKTISEKFIVCIILLMMLSWIIGVSSYAESNLWHIVEQKKSSNEGNKLEAGKIKSQAIDISDQQALEKYNFYVEQNNFIEYKLALIVWSYDRLFTGESDQFLTPSKESLDEINFFNVLDVFVERMARLETYANMSPFNGESDSCAIDMSRDAVNVMETINQLYDYYDGEGYLKDDFSKGKALHKKLRDGLECLDISKNAFKEVFGMTITHTEVSERIRLFNEDYLIHYNAIEALVIAKQLVSGLEDISIDDEWVSLNAIYNDEYGRFIEYYDAFVNESSKSDQLSFEGFDSSNGIGRFGEDLLNLKVAIKELNEAISANTLSDEGKEYVELSDGIYIAYMNFLDEYKLCVSAYNKHFRGRKSHLMIDNHGYFVKLY